MATRQPWVLILAHILGLALASQLDFLKFRPRDLSRTTQVSPLHDWHVNQPGTLRKPPATFPLPDFLAVFEPVGDAVGASLEDWGVAVRGVLDTSLPTHGAVLVKGLHCIRSAADFKVFWRACCSTSPRWTTMEYNPFYRNREQDEGVDLATNIKGSLALPCHNEMAYNPIPAGRIALFCLQDARQGGESLLVPNAVLTDGIRDEVKRWVKEHGGVLYIREYYDENAKPSGTLSPWAMSWQEKCGISMQEEIDPAKAKATQYFLSMGFKPNDINFDRNNTLTVKYVHPGTIKGNNGKELWFNILDTGMCCGGDGTRLPENLLQDLRDDAWATYSAIKLEPGDWLMFDNLQVQHGRLPFVEEELHKRKLLAVYTA